MRTELRVPLVTLYLVVHGPIYERYAAQLLEDAAAFWFPDDHTEIVILPGSPKSAYAWPMGERWPALWSHVSATRYQVALDNWQRLRGQYIFQMDADMRIVAPVGREMLSNGVTTSLHPGVPPDLPASEWPYERDPRSRAYVPYGAEGAQYHPGCFVGAPRDTFFELAEAVSSGVRGDLEAGVFPAWYEEAHLNHYLVEHPASLVLGREYCWWAHWTADGDHAAAGAKLVHLDKASEEFETRE